MKLYIQDISKLFVIATAFCLTLCCIVLGAIENDLFAYSVGSIGYLITLKIIDKGM